MHSGDVNEPRMHPNPGPGPALRPSPEAHRSGVEGTRPSGGLQLRCGLQRVRELTVQAANGTNTSDDTKKIKVEIQELTKEIIVAGNATNAGRYIFSGLQTNEKLFNEDGSYNIDMTSERRDLKHVMGYEVSVGEVMSVGVHPTDVFGTVDINNFFDGLITRNSTTTQKSTQATFRTEEIGRASCREIV